MRLIKLRLQNYRRFEGEHALDLNENLIALVGPNEAGKSSILDALDSVGRREAPNTSDSTRGLQDPAAVSALFALDPEDRAALTGIHNGDVVKRVWIERASDNKTTTWDVQDYPYRDLTARHDCLTLLESTSEDPVFAPGEADDAIQNERAHLYSEVKAKLGDARNKDDLDQETLAAIRRLAELLNIHAGGQEDDGASGLPVARSPEDVTREATRERTSRALAELAELESLPSPWKQIVRVLTDRIPKMAFFTEADRELQSTYQMSEIIATTPAAVANLCGLAELDLNEVQLALSTGRAGHAESLLEGANARLKERFRETWQQSTVYPRLGTPLDGVLRVFVANETGDYTFPEERSDGLRWFMALHAFLTTHGKEQPILLVDEAETHLHYDAQADLVDALMNQRIVRQVIYTTHSVGCLPPDLGCGIRAIIPHKDAERSRISNSYWSMTPDGSDKIGYAPLIFAMGAELLALTIPRFGVVVEGPSDAVLLPTLLREVTGLYTLPYRVVPGLSDVARSNAASLTSHGGKVAALSDGDTGGKEIRQMLLDEGLPQDALFDLGSVRPDCTLEDLVDGEVLANAINSELDTWGIDPYRVSATDMPDTGRWAWLELKGKETETPIKRLSKVRVAQRVVDMAKNEDASGTKQQVMRGSDGASLRELHDRLCTYLGAC